MKETKENNCHSVYKEYNKKMDVKHTSDYHKNISQTI